MHWYPLVRFEKKKFAFVDHAEGLVENISIYVCEHEQVQFRCSL